MTFRRGQKGPGLIVAALAAALLAAACSPPVNEDGIARVTVREIDQAFTDTALAELALSPETATRLGLQETRIGQQFQHRLDDRSQARFERRRLLRLELLGRLNALPDIPDDSRLARHLEIVRAQYEALTRLEAYGFGRYEPGLARPYAVDQLSGAWVDVPDLLIASHPLSTHDDAEDYLKRLAALPGAIADEKRRLLAEAETGMVPPAFVLAYLEERLRAFAALPIDAHPLLQSFGNTVATLEPRENRPPNRYREAAAQIVLDEIIPAYVEFADAVAELRETAPDTPGIWASERGADYYRDSLAFYGQPGADPEFWHQQGLAAVREIQAELDAEFRTIGLSDGSVGARLQLLMQAPGEVYAADPAGRQAVLDRLETLAGEARIIIPDILEVLPEAPMVIDRMSPYREAAFSGAAYVPATADGSRPGLFQINLADMEEWPDFTLPTLLHHEGIPGHHTESAVAAGQDRLPLIRQMIWDTAYGEGWAVYAEDLADAAGLYENDPLGRIGYLQSILFRAARLVVDTGIHEKQWTYDQAVNYLAETTGLPREAMAREVARYAVWPGQAAAYFIGRKRLLDMRDRAEAVLGGRFDQTAFDTVILTGGARPLAMVEQDVEAWYGELLRN